MSDYNVKYSEFESLLGSLPRNTPYTPYSIDITEITASDVTSSRLGYVLRRTNKYIDLTISGLPSSVTNFYGLFANCDCLVSIDLYNFLNVENCTEMFLNSAVRRIVNMFDISKCNFFSNVFTSFLTRKYVMPFVIFSSEQAAYNSAMLTKNVNRDMHIDLFTFMYKASGVDYMGNSDSTAIYDDENKTLTVSDRDDISAVFSYDVVDTNSSIFKNTSKIAPLKIREIKNSVSVWKNKLTEMPVVSVGYYHVYVDSNNPQNSTVTKYDTTVNPTDVYVDYSETMLGNETGSIDCSGDTHIIKSPVLSDGMTDLTNAFSGCSSLTEAPVLPPAVRTLSSAFAGCSSITSFSGIPATVTNLSSAFSGCTSLVEIHGFDVDTTKCTMTNAFEKCSALEHIYVKAPLIQRGKSWRLARFRLAAGEATVSLYDSELASDGRLRLLASRKQAYRNDKNAKALFYVDELIATSDLDDDTLTVLLKYKFPFGDGHVYPSATGSNFTFWAKDSSKFTSNIDFGNNIVCPFPVGATYVQFPQQDAPMDLWKKTKWEIVNFTFSGTTGSNASSANEIRVWKRIA